MNRNNENGTLVAIGLGVAFAVVLVGVSVFAYTHVINPPKNSTVASSSSPSPQASTKIASNSPAGNNGTLKVHLQGAPSGTEDNTPKVCRFNIEGFSLDAGQTGIVKIVPQGGVNVSGVNSIELPIGPADNKGYAQTDYVNLNGDLAISNGLYKSTLYGKDSKGENTVDLKAKSKVFQVNCTE